MPVLRQTKDSISQHPEGVEGVKRINEFLEQLLKQANIGKQMFSILENPPIMGLEERMEEMEIRRLLLQHLHLRNKQKHKLTKKITCQYLDGNISLLKKKIPIPKNTNMEDICKIIFKNNESKSKTWSWDEILEKWGDIYDKDDWRKIYNAAREINIKVAVKTTIEDLLIVTTKTVALNPEYR